MKTSPLNKKIAIPAIVAVAAMLAGIGVFGPSAIAQQQMNGNNSNGNTYNSGGMVSTMNVTNQTMPKINGTLNVIQIIKDKIKVSFSEAASTAQKQISNGTVVAGHIGVVQGYLVYTFIIVDTTNHSIHNVIVDAGNGKVLYTSPAHTMGSFGEHFGGFGAAHEHGMMMMHKFGMMMHGFGGEKMMNRTNSTAQWQMMSPNNMAGM
jgi:uncharacterized membrane protein YkoI